MLNNLFELNMFNPFSSFTFLSPYSGGMSDKSTDSSQSVDSSF